MSTWYALHILYESATWCLFCSARSNASLNARRWNSCRMGPQSRSKLPAMHLRSFSAAVPLPVWSTGRPDSEVVGRRSFNTRSPVSCQLVKKHRCPKHS